MDIIVAANCNIILVLENQLLFDHFLQPSYDFCWKFFERNRRVWTRTSKTVFDSGQVCVLSCFCTCWKYSSLGLRWFATFLRNTSDEDLLSLGSRCKMLQQLDILGTRGVTVPGIRRYGNKYFSNVIIAHNMHDMIFSGYFSLESSWWAAVSLFNHVKRGNENHELIFLN